jgi:4,5:9,10-diseco-3-hydroxy-5,9,17-trioxoandrosta-1(10),2-diene-4-oate hydrolase
VRAADASLAAYEAGSDAPSAPVVLLLHGLGHWTDAAWGRLVPQLDPALRYVAFDLPGFGASDKPDAAFDLAYFRRVLDDVVAALGLERFALVGHSLGGFIAADYAGAHPARVTHLALVAPAAFARTPRHLLYALAGGFARPLFERRPSRRFVMRMLLRSVLDPNALDPAVVERAYELSQEPALRKAFAGVYAGAMHAFTRARELHAGFARYPGPVFCAWGAHDRYINVAALREVGRIYPHAKTLVLNKSGHLPMVEEPQELGAALRDFLKN